MRYFPIQKLDYFYKGSFVYPQVWFSFFLKKKWSIRILFESIDIKVKKMLE